MAGQQIIVQLPACFNKSVNDLSSQATFHKAAELLMPQRVPSESSCNHMMDVKQYVWYSASGMDITVYSDQSHQMDEP